jgi:hypothetical protein
MRLTILAFDQSKTHTGYAVYVAPGEPGLIRTGSFSCIEKNRDPADVFASMCKSLANVYKPDFFAWERSKPSISTYVTRGKDDLAGPKPNGWTVNARQLILPELQGIIRGMAKAYGKPYANALPSTWRAAVFGGGRGNMKTAEAKAAAKQHCARLRILANNEHEAEAACVALWAASSIEFRMAMDKAHKRAAAEAAA